MKDGGAVVRVRLPVALRPLAGGSAEARCEGRTVGDILRSLERAHPGLGDRLLDADGRPRRYLTLFLNDDDIRLLSGLDTRVQDGDELTVVPAIAGGSPCR